MGELQTGVRVRAEGLGITAKSVTTFAVLYFGSADVALISFALGQLMYSLMMLTAYVVYLGFTPLLPKNVSSPAMKSTGNGLLANVDQDALHLSFTMTLQSLVKHVLTEGDKVVLSWFSPLRDQGGYAIAVNYGTHRKYSSFADALLFYRISYCTDYFPAYRRDASSFLFSDTRQKQYYSERQT